MATCHLMRSVGIGGNRQREVGQGNRITSPRNPRNRRPALQFWKKVQSVTQLRQRCVGMAVHTEQLHRGGQLALMCDSTAHCKSCRTLLRLMLRFKTFIHSRL